MFKKNEGTLDRVLRVVVGAAMILGFFVYRDAAYSWLLLLGVIPLVTGLVGSCPVYSVLGVATCPMKKS